MLNLENHCYTKEQVQALLDIDSDENLKTFLENNNITTVIISSHVDIENLPTNSTLYFKKEDIDNHINGVRRITLP